MHVASIALIALSAFCGVHAASGPPARPVPIPPSGPRRALPPTPVSLLDSSLRIPVPWMTFVDTGRTLTICGYECTDCFTTDLTKDTRLTGHTDKVVEAYYCNACAKPDAEPQPLKDFVAGYPAPSNDKNHCWGPAYTKDQKSIGWLFNYVGRGAVKLFTNVPPVAVGAEVMI